MQFNIAFHLGYTKILLNEGNETKMIPVSPYFHAL